MCKKHNNYNDLIVNKTIIHLILTGFTKTDFGEIKLFDTKDNGKFIQANFKVVKYTRKETCDEMITQLIPISGDESAHGRKIIRDMMEASGFAKKGDFNSYSINNYNELINISFPSCIKNGKIERIINPYSIALPANKLEKGC